jgi:pimeloyl-ACP methyl ester carboxylesterase
MYYEVQGSGRPLVLLHGAYMTVDMMEPLRSGLAKTRQVVAAEQQGHGRTADVDPTARSPTSRWPTTRRS